MFCLPWCSPKVAPEDVFAPYLVNTDRLDCRDPMPLVTGMKQDPKSEPMDLQTYLGIGLTPSPESWEFWAMCDERTRRA